MKCKRLTPFGSRLKRNLETTCRAGSVTECVDAPSDLQQSRATSTRSCIGQDICCLAQVVAVSSCHPSIGIQEKVFWRIGQPIPSHQGTHASIPQQVRGADPDDYDRVMGVTSAGSLETAMFRQGNGAGIVLDQDGVANKLKEHQ